MAESAWEKSPYRDKLLADIQSNSFKDFHCKGLDYICLSRNTNQTIKYYFFEQGRTQVVMPHNHRYDFITEVKAGRLINHTYATQPMIRSPEGEINLIGDVYEEFAYYTPLNRGSGFNHVGQARLKEIHKRRYEKGQRCPSPFGSIHTISVFPGTVLKLTQERDLLPTTDPTRAFSKDGNARPNTSGLYRRFHTDEIISRLRHIEQLGERL